MTALRRSPRQAAMISSTSCSYSLRNLLASARDMQAIQAKLRASLVNAGRYSPLSTGWNLVVFRSHRDFGDRQLFARVTASLVAILLGPADVRGLFKR